MRMIKDNVTLSERIITDKTLSHNAILAYTGLRIVMLRDSYITSELAYDLCISIDTIAYELGIQESDKSTFKALKQGMKELEKNHLISKSPYKKTFLTNVRNLYIDSIEGYIKVDTSSINLLMSSDQKEKIPLLRYFIVLISIGGYDTNVRKKITHSHYKMFCLVSSSQMDCEMTYYRYNSLLEDMGIIQKSETNAQCEVTVQLK